jgi:hypothetical protein
MKNIVRTIPAAALPIFERHLAGFAFKSAPVPATVVLTITPTAANIRALEDKMKAAQIEAAKLK